MSAKRLSKLQRFLIEPAPSIQDVALRRNSRLLAIFLLVMTAIFGGVDITWTLTIPGYIPPWYGYAFLATAYALNRTKYYKVAATVTIFMFPLVIFSRVLSNTSGDPVNVLSLSVVSLILGSIFLSIRATAFLAALHLVGILLMPLLAGEAIPEFDLIIGPLRLTGIGAVLILVFMYHRNQIEKDRQAELRRSEERLRSALSAARMGTWDWDILTGVVTWSEYVELIFGLQKGEFKGTYEAYLDLILPEDVRVVQQAISAALAGEMEAYEVEHRIVWPDGSIHWLEGKGQVYRDKAGHPIRMMGTVTDITERKQAEEKLRKWAHIFEHAEWGIVIGDPVSGILELMNPAFARMHGYTVEELIGTPITDIFAPESRAEVPEYIRLTHQKGHHTFESEHLRKDGTIFPVLIDATAVKDEDGNILYRVVNVQDITERKCAELELRSSREVLARAQKMAHLGSWEWDMVTNEVRWSEEMFRIHGITSEQFAGTLDYALQVIHPDDRERIQQGVQRVIEERISFPAEYRIVRPDQTVRTVIGEGYLITDDDGNPLRLIGTCLDITEIKEAEVALKAYSERLEEMVEERTQELREAQEQLVRQEKLAVLGQLAGGVGHELRNPLGVISNAVYFLQMVLTEADETVKEYLEIIASRMHEAERIVSDLLNLSRIKPAQREEIAVSALVTEVLARHPSPEAVTVTTDIPPNLPPLFVDPQQIRQALANLVTNAYQAMPDGGELSIRAAGNDKQVYLSLTDTGCGMSPETTAKIFEPLFTTKAKGIGLGLAVSKNLVEVNGGSIKVESIEGRGSIFTVILPITGAA